jgi:hypothetical protein
MTTTTAVRTPAAGPILAIDLGKYKSVAAGQEVLAQRLAALRP